MLLIVICELVALFLSYPIIRLINHNLDTVRPPSIGEK